MMNGYEGDVRNVFQIPWNELMAARMCVRVMYNTNTHINLLYEYICILFIYPNNIHRLKHLLMYEWKMVMTIVVYVQQKDEELDLHVTNICAVTIETIGSG